MTTAPSPTAFPAGYRASGVLLHVTSLPSRFGVGDVGPAACAWVDRLAEAGQSWWQVLPLGPIGRGNSPYEPVSSFAGNTLLISPEWLADDGLLDPDDWQGRQFPAESVDYASVIPFKTALLERARKRFAAGAAPALQPLFETFCVDQAGWLEDYALFVALKARHGDVPYREWPGELVRRDPVALERARAELAEAIDAVKLEQFLIHRQWCRLREYAHKKGVRLFGDVPIFVSPESCDVWAHPELFVLDDDLAPRVLAGVPPDYFAEHGQLWRNPLYDWPALKATGYRWWIDRLKTLLASLDLVRIDHFRAFEAAWHVPVGSETAERGEWIPGPGADFFRVVAGALGGLPFVAEDLGMITPAVRALRDEFHLPGMRVLQFAFDGFEDNPFLPHNFVENAVVYTGTHDNDTTRGWYRALPDDQRARLLKYLKRESVADDEIVWAMIGLAQRSIAALAIFPLQDLLNVDSRARMNLPGEPAGNWRWRAPADPLPAPVATRLRELTTETGRLQSTTAD